MDFCQLDIHGRYGEVIVFKPVKVNTVKPTHVKKYVLTLFYLWKS
jgi:hypothetical protein